LEDSAGFVSFFKLLKFESFQKFKASETQNLLEILLWFNKFENVRQLLNLIDTLRHKILLLEQSNPAIPFKASKLQVV
jgi:hypothetical protein